MTIRGIPLAAYDYVVNGKSAIEWVMEPACKLVADRVNGKSAIEWVMERCQVTTNKDSGIVNDPNKWLAECGNGRYIVNLVCKIVTVSMETLNIVAQLPRFTF